jgi:hypothetical protein
MYELVLVTFHRVPYLLWRVGQHSSLIRQLDPDNHCLLWSQDLPGRRIQNQTRVLKAGLQVLLLSAQVAQSSGRLSCYQVGSTWASTWSAHQAARRSSPHHMQPIWEPMWSISRRIPTRRCRQATLQRQLRVAERGFPSLMRHYESHMISQPRMAERGFPSLMWRCEGHMISQLRVAERGFPSLMWHGESHKTPGEEESGNPRLTEPRRIIWAGQAGTMMERDGRSRRRAGGTVQ